MKKISVLILLAMLLSVACKDSEKSNSNDASEEKKIDSQAEFDLKLYKHALTNADAYTAIAALNSYILRDSNSATYKDTLLQLYIQTQQIAAIYRLSTDILKVRPNDTTLLQLSIATAQEIGYLDEVVGNVKKLLDMDPNNLNLKYQYGIALLQRNNTDEGMKMLDEVITNPNARKRLIPYTYFDKNGQPRKANVKLNLAAIMVKGQYYTQIQDYDTAEKYFRQVWDTDINFPGVALLITELRQIRKQAGK